MLHLLDANVLIDAQRDYYPIDRVPEFWAWLEYQGHVGAVKIPIEMYEEIVEGHGPLVDWLKLERVKEAMILSEDSDPGRVEVVVTTGYADNLSDDEQLNLGRDPFLIAHALADAANRCVVTTEVSKPSRQRANRHVPDVCAALGTTSCNTFELTRRLDFSTSWSRPAA